MRRLLLCVCLLAGLVSPALAEEAILDFLSDVTVDADASLTVTEAIVINVEGNEIRHGIKRDFPTTYTDRHGSRLRVGFEVLRVTRDGQPEPFSVESVSNGKSIKIGDGDVFLQYGPHRYEITYKTTRQLGFFEKFDELYWNVTGNGWDFPIDKATAIIRLPPGARILQHSEYTGAQGSTANNSEVQTATGNYYSASTTRPLGPKQGFTVAVAWQKGIVAAPTANQQMQWWLWDNAGFFMLIVSVFASGIYYLHAWNKVGRDPPKGTIIPLFAPPDGLGPAGTRFVWKTGFDNKGFAAAVVGLAVKGMARIIDDGSDYSIQKLANSEAALSRAERRFYGSLPSGTTQLKQVNHVKVAAMRSGLEKALKEEFEGSLFVRNLSWFWKGAAISLVGLLISAFLLPADDGLAGLVVVVWMGVWWGVVLAVGWAAVKGTSAARGILGKLGSFAKLLFLVPFVFGGFAAPVAILSGGGSPGLYMLIGTAVLLGLMNLAFFHLLRAPTVPGRKILDQIEGFRMYMRTAEEERLMVLNPPEKTPELFERYLPYALALDCENEWNTKFAAVLAAAAAAGAAAPLWYSGRDWNADRMGSFTDSVGSSLASTISSASSAPGSSSGSSGGGSSGGGGGGGGGSGW